MFSRKKLEKILPRPFVYCDVGARWGASYPWNLYKDFIRVISFEPDEEEANRLKEKSRPQDLCISSALYGEEREMDLYLTRSRGCSSIYKPNLALLSLYPDLERFSIDVVAKIKTTTIDHLHASKVIDQMDFIKLDVQGPELEILRGGRNLIKEQVVGLEVEVGFSEMYEGQPFFADVDQYIRKEFDFQLFDLRKSFWKFESGKKFGGPKGQLMFGDALYLRAPNKILPWVQNKKKEDARDKILMSVFAGIAFGYIDYSICVLSQPGIQQYFSAAEIAELKNAVTGLGWNVRSLFAFRVNYRITRVFHGLANTILSLYRLVQPSHEGWAVTEDKLGSTKRAGWFQ
jgi:FkbM family methyltransferase